MTLLRLNGSPTPERLMTERLVVSTVVNRRPHSGHWRRRRMAEPSSAIRLSTTRESGLRQNGQYMAFPLPLGVERQRISQYRWTVVLRSQFTAASRVITSL